MSKQNTKSKPRLSSRDSALFAVLMREEYIARTMGDFANTQNGLYNFDFGGKYYQFLRSQSKHADANCPYRRAVALIEGSA